MAGNHARNLDEFLIGYIHKMKTAYKGLNWLSGKSLNGRMSYIQDSPMGATRHDNDSILLVENQREFIIKSVEFIDPVVDYSKTG